MPCNRGNPLSSLPSSHTATGSRRETACAIRARALAGSQSPWRSRALRPGVEGEHQLQIQLPGEVRHRVPAVARQHPARPSAAGGRGRRARRAGIRSDPRRCRRSAGRRATAPPARLPQPRSGKVVPGDGARAQQPLALPGGAQNSPPTTCAVSTANERNRGSTRAAGRSCAATVAPLGNGRRFRGVVGSQGQRATHPHQPPQPSRSGGSPVIADIFAPPYRNETATGAGDTAQWQAPPPGPSPSRPAATRPSPVKRRIRPAHSTGSTRAGRIPSPGPSIAVTQAGGIPNTPAPDASGTSPRPSWRPHRACARVHRRSNQASCVAARCLPSTAAGGRRPARRPPPVRPPGGGTRRRPRTARAPPRGSAARPSCPAKASGEQRQYSEGQRRAARTTRSRSPL